MKDGRSEKKTENQSSSGLSSVGEARIVVQPSSQETGMRFRKRTLAGENVGCGVAGPKKGELVSQGVRGGVDSGDEGREPIGFERVEVFRRRTGPEAGVFSGSGIRERSAMSQGLVCSGAASRADTQGSWSKGWGPRSVRRDGRRRRGAGLVLRRDAEEHCGTVSPSHTRRDGRTEGGEGTGRRASGDRRRCMAGERADGGG
jgi:hypothetical protein